MMWTWLTWLPRLLPRSSRPAELLPRVREEGSKGGVAPNLSEFVMRGKNGQISNKIPEGQHPGVGASTSEAIVVGVDIPTGRVTESLDLPAG